MKYLTSCFSIAAFALLTHTASAQATRTWVSGVGDDVNPCSRTAPGKTFAGAISKTAVDGIIDVLDPGGFGAVTITKGITIDGGGIEGNIVFTAGSAILVNAPAGSVVTLRNLNIDGLNNPNTNGIRIVGGGAVYIENCHIKGCSNGIVEATATLGGTQVFVANTFVQECETAGITMTPTGTISSTMVLEKSRIINCGTGLTVNTRASATISDCTISFSVGGGLIRTGTGVITSSLNNRVFKNNPDGTTNGVLFAK